MPYPVPPSRLYPPRTAREVFRVRPLRLLEEAFRKSPGVVLAAGAGYGKTSLAAELPAVYVSLAEEAKDQGLSFEPAGRRQVKGFDVPVTVWSLASS